MKQFLLLLSIAFTLIGCNNNKVGRTDFSDCKYQAPAAIFSDSLSRVSRHQFALRQLEGVEEIDFDNGLNLTIIQSGCDAIRQEFQFQISGQSFPSADKNFWITQTIDWLKFLSSLHPKYLSFNDWGKAISIQAPSIELGEPIELQDGFFVEIDKIISSDHAILLLILSQKI